MSTNKNSYKHLLSPGRIGTLELRNRIVVTAMGVNLAELDGSWGERIRAYHETQAKGGAGLIITGATGVSYPVGGVQPRQAALSEDRFIPGFKAVVDAVHAHGAKIAVQLHHAGPNSINDMLAGRPVYVPSLPKSFGSGYARALLPDDLAVSAFGRIASIDFREMTRDDIARLIADFAAAALRSRQAGADGVEIHGGHGYVLSSFLSPGSNFRTDEYGGPLENRARLLLEVLRAVRTAVGAGYPVWVKLDSRENDKTPGITIDDAMATAKMVEAAGADAITVTTYHSTEQGKMDSGSHTPTESAVNLPFTARIKAAVRIPVIGSGRVEPEVGDAAIRDGQVDFISMGRKLLADPELPNKLAEGRAEDIRPCIYCNTCISAIFRDESSRCAVNPALGLEYLAKPVPAGVSKRIAVIGGGPGGMEAARRLHAAGHKVTLFEKGERLGGTLRLAALAYAANERLLDWLQRQIDATDIEVRLNTEATADLLRELQADAVVVATGAVRRMPAIPGNDLPHVFSGDDLRTLLLGGSSDALKRKTGLLTRVATQIGAATGITSNLDFVRKATHQWMPLGQNIVIVGGELVGLELAEFLAERGRTVTLVDDSPGLGAGLTILRRVWILDELEHRGVGLHPRARDIHIESDSVRFVDEAGEAQAVSADHVIVAKGAAGDHTLADRLRAQGFAVHTVGDCNGVSYIEGAMRGAADAVDVICWQA